MTGSLPQDELAALDAQVERALATGDQTGITVLGCGEISCIALARSKAGEFACKRLPTFENQQSLDNYKSCFELYLKRLQEHGAQPVESELRTIPREDGRITAYCIQPALPSGCFGHRYLTVCDPEEALRFVDLVLDSILQCTGETLGLDGQMSNWALHDGKLLYMDVTTPLMRDAQGRELLDTELFMKSLPWALRGLVRRFFLGEIIDKYYLPRGVILDILGNLLKENLAKLIPTCLEQANVRLPEAIQESEVHRYYRSDAKMWALMQRLRRADRWWQRRIRRRTYPFLLPGKISRNL